jgi:recombining binding protein suppressor of hairless
LAAKFQYTFFDAFGHKDSIPDAPITPFPTLFTGPCYRPGDHTIELTVSNFFYEDPKTKSRVALDVYLGTLGPLQHRIYAQPTDGAASMQSIVEMSAAGQSVMIAPGNAQAMGYGVHSIVIVQLPPLEDILRALQDDLGRDSSGGNGSGDRESSTTSIDSATGATTAIPASSISGRSLPLLFIRPTDGVGYHSGRTVVCENVFQNLDLSSIASAGTGDDASWIAAAQAAAAAAAAAAEGGLHGWSLRVI